MTRALTFIFFGAFLSIHSFAARPKLPPHPKATVPPTEQARMAIVEKAGTWIGADRKGRSVLQGPQQKDPLERFTFNEEVRCKFIEPEDLDDRPGGKTPKFRCLKGGEDFKVKYQTEREWNSGVWGEILSTRLFWALGFPADAIYPVRVMCENCPEKPWRYLDAYFTVKQLKEFEEELKRRGQVLNSRNRKRLQRAQRTVEKYKNTRSDLFIEDAVIELKYKNKRRVERYEHQGWNWNEFDRITKDPKLARKIKIERDALALLAAFIQHADNKAEQQRVICLDKKSDWVKITCNKPVLMIQDLGFTFGSGWILKGEDPKQPGRLIGNGTTADLKGFVEAPIWNDPKKCITKIHYFVPTGIPANKQVSEEGRKFLVDKLVAFTKNEQNLKDLFTAGRVERNVIKNRETNKSHTYSVQQWVQGFKEKVKKLENHTCPKL